MGQIAPVVGVEVPGCRRELALLASDPGLEARSAHHLPGVEHMPVEEPAELGAADVEAAGLGRARVGDVVDAGIRVGLHPQPMGPERVDRVQRGDVELYVLVNRKLQMRRLDATEGGEPVGEGPLLGDHLHLQWVSRRLRDGIGALPAARSAVSEYSYGAI